MKWALITPDGELTHHDGEPDWNAVIGPEGRARVRLPDLAVAGWVNDVGHVLTEKYPRNITGSCVLIALGALRQPYAGPVVFTGWEPRHTALGLPEIVSLPQPGFLTAFHREVTAALEGRHTAHPPRWAAAIREIADFVHTAPTPGITIRPGRPW
ncbi:hypothetical protein ACFY1J_31180 [Streptomyces sp. NPDC001406]|uniref:hypothetical protein n=1 Tax=Streptomyces sp. NPDC001406 TaxID=3364572 RepID=UPI0036BF5F63